MANKMLSSWMSAMFITSAMAHWDGASTVAWWRTSMDHIGLAMKEVERL
jgi:hypothetical protein